MYARTEGVRRLRSMYSKTSFSAYRMDPSNLTQAGPSPTLRQYRIVPSGIESISETDLVVSNFCKLFSSHTSAVTYTSEPVRVEKSSLARC
jgi:hypothetical protein